MKHLQHEPETKAFNKARDFQDAIIRARKDGCENPLDVAEAIYDWFMDSQRSVQIATISFAVARMWNNVHEKLEKAGAPVIAKRRVLSVAKKDEIRKKVRADLENRWLDVVLKMTGAQARAVAALPAEILGRVGDNQRFGDVFTADELRMYAPQ